MKFWIDFEGYCTVEADSPQQAREKFLTYDIDCALDTPVFEVRGVEEVSED